MLSEEEIIKEIEIIKESQDIIQYNLDIYPPKEDIYRLDTKQLKAVICLLDLYKKEKERNALLLANNNGYFELKKYIKNNYISKDKIRKYLNSLKYWEDNNTSFLESKGEIFLNKEFIVNIFEDLLKES